MNRLLLVLMVLITLGVGVKTTSLQAYQPTYESHVVNVKVIAKEGNFYAIETIVERFHRPYQFEMYSQQEYNINEKIYVKLYENGDVEEWQNNQ